MEVPFPHKAYPFFGKQAEAQKTREPENPQCNEEDPYNKT